MCPGAHRRLSDTAADRADQYRGGPVALQGESGGAVVLGVATSSNGLHPSSDGLQPLLASCYSPLGGSDILLVVLCSLTQLDLFFYQHS